MGNKFEIHPDLRDASLEKVCEMADRLHTLLITGPNGPDHVTGKAHDLSYMLEYLRLNFDLVPKK